MAVDFKSLLSKPADDVKPPVPLPVGTYHGLIKSFEFKESDQKKTPFVRFQVQLSNAGEDVDQEELKEIDLTKKALRKDFFLTDEAAYRLKEFTDSCGIASKGRSLGEIIQDTVNQPVIVEITHRMNTKDPTQPAYAEINTIKGQG